jgi:hypothetical protein
MSESSASKPYEWSKLTHLQIGKYAEYFVKMELTLYGFDVYSAEVDDKGIDFILRSKDGRYYDVQVKSSRNMNYIFLPKSLFQPRESLLAAIVQFTDGQLPEAFLIRSTAWLTPNRLLVSRDFEGRRSKPEWGLNFAKRNRELLEQHALARIAPTL